MWLALSDGRPDNRIWKKEAFALGLLALTLGASLSLLVLWHSFVALRTNFPRSNVDRRPAVLQESPKTANLTEDWATPDSQAPLHETTIARLPGPHPVRQPTKSLKRTHAHTYACTHTLILLVTNYNSGTSLCISKWHTKVLEATNWDRHLKEKTLMLTYI